MADTTIRLEFKDDTPPGAAPTPEPNRNYLTGEVQKPQAAPLPTVAAPADVISPSVYKSYSPFERSLADRLMAEGQLRLGEEEEAPVKLTPAQGEKATREQERQDRLARKVARAMIETETQAGGGEEMRSQGEQESLAREASDRRDRDFAAKLFENQRKEAEDAKAQAERQRAQGEREAREKEANDARDRAAVLRHLEATIPLAERVPDPDEAAPTKFGDTMTPLLMRAMGAGGAARLAGRFIDRHNRSAHAVRRAKTLRSRGDEGGAQKVEAGEEATKAAEKIPIVGDVIDAVEVVAKTIQAGADAMRIGMKAQSDTVVELAGNNYMGAFNKQVEGAANTMRQIPLVGGMLASGMELAVQPVRSFTDVVQAFVDRGRDLSQYSGPLASANAQADIRGVLADLREANELGPQLAELTTLQSQAWIELREIMLPIKKVIVEDLIVIMREVIDIAHAEYQGIKEVEKASVSNAVTGGLVAGALNAALIQLGIIAAQMPSSDTAASKEVGITDIFDAHFNGPDSAAAVPKQAFNLPVLPKL